MPLLPPHNERGFAGSALSLRNILKVPLGRNFPFLSLSYGDSVVWRGKEERAPHQGSPRSKRAANAAGTTFLTRVLWCLCLAPDLPCLSAKVVITDDKRLRERLYKRLLPRQPVVASAPMSELARKLPEVLP